MRVDENTSAHNERRSLLRPQPLGERQGVALWCCVLDDRAAEARSLEAWLAPGERARAERFGTAVLRDRYVAGRVTLRLLLGAALAIPPAHVPIRRGPRGRPMLEAPHWLDFNVSHTEGFAVFALGTALARGSHVGIDVEKSSRRPGVDRLARKLLSDPERQAWNALALAPRTYRFLELWTCKEAMSKATGDGLLAPFGRITVDAGPAPRLCDGPAPYAPADWSLHRIEAPLDHLVALAIWRPHNV